MKQKLKSILQNIACDLMSWNTNWYSRLMYVDEFCVCQFRGGDLVWHINNLIDALSHRIFLFAFEGSEEQERDALELAYGCVFHHYDARQREIILQHYDVKQRLLSAPNTI